MMLLPKVMKRYWAAIANTGRTSGQNRTFKFPTITWRIFIISPFINWLRVRREIIHRPTAEDFGLGIMTFVAGVTIINGTCNSSIGRFMLLIMQSLPDPTWIFAFGRYLKRKTMRVRYTTGKAPFIRM